MPDRISSLDRGYISGDLSIYPHGLDSKDTLYEARNNAQATLKQTLTFNGQNIIVDDASTFPDKGLLRVGPPPGSPGNYELVYYGQRSNNIFSKLVRGFAGSIQTQFYVGSWVSNAVMAEHHNAVKDAVLNMENNLGVKDFPTAASLNGILKGLETRFLAPKPIFRALPLRGVPPLKVRFQNYSGGDPIRFLWEFGDGSSSTDLSPTHTYTQEGIYTVKLNMITALGAQGIATKTNYITVSNDLGINFFYVDSLVGVSEQTATALGTTPTAFTFVDQTQGPIVERIWNFDDGNRLTTTDGDFHTTTHTYAVPGNYQPVLLDILNNGQLKRIELPDLLTVS
jgi:PKD repeat protein